MRVAIIQGAFLPVPPLRGGAIEKRWFRVGKEIAGKGCVVAHYSRLCDELPRKEDINGVQHRRVRGYDTPRSLLWLKFLDGLYSLRVKRILAPADVVVTNTFWMPFLLRNQAKWGKVVVDFARMPKGQVRFYKHVACIRVNSLAVKEAVLRECPEVEPIVRFIPNPLPFTPPDRLALEQKAKVLMYAGRIHPEKGLHLLAEAWREISSEFPDWTLEIAGPHATAHGGGGDDYLAKLKQQFGNSSVLWHGSVNEPGALEQLYARASVFVYPSVAEKGETFGLAPLEAMAYGAVPLLSSLECFSEFIQPEVNGMVFDHRSANANKNLQQCLRSLMSTGPGREAMRQKAFETARSFSPEIIAGQFMALFSELVKPDQE